MVTAWGNKQALSRKTKATYYSTIFSHPDYTVGSGITPDPAQNTGSRA
ncbi:hypothetical protein QO000_003227 [Alkalihalobacillus hemicentroti]|uniref:Uncharacterized protein n=1 Tax=Guptibacillus hwajinpoensis TaxID=208199 RepID=A0ABU0K4G0_9BACL|nr:hypothetical protein [Alkalihalobacillus hemicentroti]